MKPSADGSSQSTWQELHTSAMLELDNSKVFGRIAEARQAIRDRAKELLGAASVTEGHELNDALRNLESLEAVLRRENQLGATRPPSKGTNSIISGPARH
jgi:hypothetical protein